MRKFWLALIGLVIGIVATSFAAESADPQTLLSTHIDIARLEKASPGWNMTGVTGDATSGTVTIERIIWPAFYLHWRSFEKAGAGPAFDALSAAGFLRKLWDEDSIDSLSEAREIALPAHPAFRFEASTGHGNRTTRYIVWACPLSGRLFAVDMNLDLRTATPLSLFDWQEEMARTVRCHPNAPIEEFPRLPRRREIADVGVSFSHPFTWAPIEGYRVQKTFEGGDFSGKQPIATKEEGNDLILVADAVRRLHVSWAPTPDYPMDFDVLRTRQQDYWRERAVDILEIGTKVSNDVWIFDGVARPGPKRAISFPSSRRHRYRAWMWRRGAVSYFAVADVAEVFIGRRAIGLATAAWDLNLEEMYQGILY